MELRMDDHHPVLGAPMGRFVDTKNGRTHYILQEPEENNKDNRLIIAAHGLGTSLKDYDNEFCKAWLDLGYAVLRYDYYGRGWSKPNKEKLEYTSELFIDQVEAILTAIHASERYKCITFVGYSTGGAVGVELATTGRHNIDQLILVSPAIRAVPKPFTAKMAEQGWVASLIQAMLMSVAKKTYLKAFEEFFTQTDEGRATFTERRLLLVRMMEESSVFLPAVVQTNAGLLTSESLNVVYEHFNALLALPAHKMRILLIWGTDDVTTPPPDKDLIKSWSDAGAIVHTIDGGRHGMIFEKTKRLEMVRTTVDFITQAPSNNGGGGGDDDEKKQ